MPTIAVGSRSTVAAAGLLVLFSLLCTRIPLLNYLGFESSLATALVCGFLSGLIVLKWTAPDQEMRARRRTMKQRAAGLSLLVLVPLVILSLNALVVKNCSFSEGLLLYVLMVVPAVFFCASLARLVAASVRRQRVLLFSFLCVVILLHVPWVTLTRPQVYAFNPLLGYFPGITYDEVLPVDHRLWIHRAATLAAGAAFLIFSRQIQRVRGTLPGLRQPRAELALGLAAMAVVCLTYLESDRLGLSSSEEHIADELGGRYQSAHFVIYYPPSSLDEDGIFHLALLHEFYYERTASVLGIQNGRPVISFVYESPEQKARLVGAGETNFAKPWLRQIHINAEDVEESLKHELAHVLAADFGIPVFGIGASPGLIEGLAVALEGVSYDETPHRLAAQLRAIGKDVPVSELFTIRGFMGAHPATSYSRAGSFLQFLMDTRGASALLRLYRTGNFEEVYGTSLEDLAHEWDTLLARIEVTPGEIRRARYLFDRPPIFGKICARAVARVDDRTRRLLQEKQYERALESAGRSLGMSPRPTAAVQYAAALFRLARYDDVLSFGFPRLSDSLQERSLVTLRLTMGDALWMKGLHGQALEQYRLLAGLHLNPAFDEAVQLRLRVLAEEPRNHVLRQCLLGGLPDSTAIVLLQDSLLRFQADADLVRYMLAKRYMNQKDYRGAARQLQHIGSLGSPELDFERRGMLGRCWYWRREFQKARSDFWQSLNHTEREATLLNVREWIERCEWMEQWMGRRESLAPDVAEG